MQSVGRITRQESVLIVERKKVSVASTMTTNGDGWGGSIDSGGTDASGVYWDTNITNATSMHLGACGGASGNGSGTVTTTDGGVGGNGFSNQHNPIVWQNVVVKTTPPVVKKLTKAEKREEVERRKRIEAARIEAQKRLDTAKEKGDKLLKQIIGDILFKTYKDVGHVDVHSIDKPEIMYRIRPRREIGVLRKVSGEWKQTESLCIHPNTAYVEGDVAAIHVLLCKFDEKMLWEKANLHRMAA